jgi:hypothetical protein
VDCIFGAALSLNTLGYKEDSLGKAALSPSQVLALLDRTQSASHSCLVAAGYTECIRILHGRVRALPACRAGSTRVLLALLHRTQSHVFVALSHTKPRT